MTEKKYSLILGDFILKGEIIDNGYLAQKISQTIIDNFNQYGVTHVEINFDKAAELISTVQVSDTTTAAE